MKIKKAIKKVNSWPKPVRYFLGCLCVVLGIAGLVLPFLQGVLFLAAALVLFGLIEHQHLDKALTKWRKYWDSKK